MNKRKYYNEEVAYSDKRFNSQPGSNDIKITFQLKVFNYDKKLQIEKFVGFLKEEVVPFAFIDKFYVVVSEDLSMPKNIINLDIQLAENSVTYADPNLEHISYDKMSKIISRDFRRAYLDKVSYSDIVGSVINKSLSDAKYNHLRNIDYENKNFVFDLYKRCNDLGFLIKDIGEFADFCLSKFNDFDTEEILKLFVNKEVDQLKCEDGIARLVFLDGISKDGEVDSKISEIYSKLEHKGLTPLICIVSEAEDFEIGTRPFKNMLIVPMEALQKN